MACNTCGLDRPGEGQTCIRCGEPLSNTYFDVLGVGQSATPEEIKAAYRTKIRSVHPDFVQHMSPDLQRLANYRATQLNKITEVLSDPLKRKDYLEELTRNRSSAGQPKTKPPDQPPGTANPAGQSWAKSAGEADGSADDVMGSLARWCRRTALELPEINFGQGVMMALIFFAVYYGVAYAVTLGAARVTSLPVLFKLIPLFVFIVKILFTLSEGLVVLARNKNGEWGRLGLAVVVIFLAVRMWQVDFAENRRIADRYSAQQKDYSGLFADIKSRLSLSLVNFTADPVRAADSARSMGVKEILANQAGLFVNIRNGSGYLIKDTSVSFEVSAGGNLLLRRSGLIRGRIQAGQTCGYVFWVPTSSGEFNALNSTDLDRANLRVQKIDPEHFAVNNEWIDPVDW